MSKIWLSQRGHKLRHNMAHTRCMLDKQSYTRVRTYAPGHTLACTHAHTHTHVFIAFPRKLLSERPSILHDTYIACLVILTFCLHLGLSNFMFRLSDKNLYAFLFPWATHLISLSWPTQSYLTWSSNYEVYHSDIMCNFPLRRTFCIHILTSWFSSQILPNYISQ